MTMLEQIFFYLGPIIFALAGLILSIYISIKKAKAQPLVCPMNGECDLVTSSRYSKFLGIPVERIGVLYYGLVLLVYVLYALIPWLLPDEVLFIMIGITIGAFIFSLYLVFIQAFVLKKWCTWCLFSAGFSTLIFITAIFSTRIDIISLLTQYKTLIIVLHAMGAAIGLGAVTVTDIFFFRFLKDFRISGSEQATMKILSNIIWFALGLMVVSGAGLFIPQSDTLLHSSKFLIKMVAIGVIIVNGVFLNLLVSPRMVEITFGEEHDHRTGELHFMRKLSFALGAISITSWYTVFILGSLKSIPIDFQSALILYVLLLCFAVIMSQVVDRKMVRSFQNGKNGTDLPPSV